MRADRLLQIVSLLRRHGRLSAADLAERLEVTARTVLRDMEALSAAGVPVYAERGRAGGFALLPGYRPAVEELTAAETQALLLSGTGAVSRIGLTKPLQSALRKVSSTLAPELTGAAERAGARIVIDPEGWFGQGEDDLTHFDAVQQAAFTDRRLRIGYLPRNATTPMARTVDPYGLLQAGRSWYLIAAHRGRPHTYRIDRITAATVLADPCHRPDDLDLRALWRQIRSSYAQPPALKLRLEITDGRPSEAMIMLGALGSGRPRIEAGPPMIMDVDVVSVRTAVAAVAGLGSRVRVIEPAEVITELQQRLREAASLYS